MSQYNITDYGALADGKTMCTEAIQRAIDLCGKGDTVYNNLEMINVEATSDED